MSAASSQLRSLSNVWRSFRPRRIPTQLASPLCRRLGIVSGSTYRTFSTTRPRLSLAQQQHIPAQPSILLTFPTEKDIEDAELDAEPIPPEEAKIELTDRAAEVRKRHTLPIVLWNGRDTAHWNYLLCLRFYDIFCVCGYGFNSNYSGSLYERTIRMRG